MIGAANTTDIVGNVFYAIVALSVVLLLGITGAMVYFAIHYNRRHRDHVKNIEGNLGLEIVWTVIPTLIVLVIFYYGYAGYMKTRRGPADSLVVEVTGRMWQWNFRYPNGAESAEMRLPVGQSVRAEMNSLDVIHSFFIPAFRIKQDAVPGKKTHIYFTPQRIGTYDVFCAEYCGTMHSKMLSQVIVMPKERFQQWYEANRAKAKPAEASAGQTKPTAAPSAREEPKPATEPQMTAAAPAAKPAPAEKPEPSAPEPAGKPSGAAIARAKACVTCHSTDGTKVLGPTWKGLYGHSVTVVTDGKERTLKADDAYLRRAIVEPGADIVKGFQPLMPVQPLSDAEIKAIIAYIKTLR